MSGMFFWDTVYITVALSTCDNDVCKFSFAIIEMIRSRVIQRMQTVYRRAFLY